MIAPTTARKMPSPINPEPVPLFMVLSSLPQHLVAACELDIPRTGAVQTPPSFDHRALGYRRHRGPDGCRAVCREEEETQMDLMERTSEKRRSFMKDRLEHKLDDTMREKDRLEQAN